MVFRNESKISEDFIKAVLSEIKDGFQFENLMKDLLVHFHSVRLLPIGEIHDSGVDSFVSHSEENKEIFQMSIQKEWKQKVIKTIDRIREKRSDLQNYRVTYLCRNVIDLSNIENIKNEVWRKYSLNFEIWPISKILQIVNYNLDTRRIFNEFCDKHAAYETIEKQSLKVFGDNQQDKTILFLKHFTEDSKDNDHIESIVKTHLFVFLRETDPEKKIFKKWEDIVSYLRSQLPNISIETLNETLRSIINKDSKRPKDEREIRDHNSDGFCASYAIRTQMAEWLSHDVVLRNDFVEQVCEMIGKEPFIEKVQTKSLNEHIPQLVIDSLGEIFFRQGLDFISHLNDSKSSLHHQELKSVVQSRASKINISQREQGELSNIASELIYEIIWHPSKVQKEYCTSMAKTFSLMFIGKADPQVLKGLKLTAQGLILILGTDIVVKILAEVHLEPVYQRFTNLIRSLKNSGVQILLTDGVLREAASHIRSTITWYDCHVRIWFTELNENPNVKELIDFEERYSRKILVRAYNHSRTSGKYNDLSELLSGFLNVNGGRFEADLRDYFDGQFQIEKTSRFIDESSQEFKWVFESLEKVAFKGHEDHSRQRIIRNDVTTICNIYDMRREFPRPSGSQFLLSERVWWLTSEKKIEKLKKSFEEKFGDAPNIVPLVMVGLLGNLSELASVSKQADSILSAALGLNMSHFVNDDLMTQLSLSYQEIKEMSPGKKKQTIGFLIEKLKREDVKALEGSLTHALDEVLEYEKTIEELAVLNTNSGFKSVWEKIRIKNISSVSKLLMFCESTNLKRMGAIEKLNSLGYKDDVRGIQKSILTTLGYKE